MIYKRIDHREKKIAIEESLIPLEFWEDIPDEDLWEDGELNSVDVKEKIYWAVVQQGEWKLTRRIK